MVVMDCNYSYKKELLRIRQHLPLDVKLKMAERRIADAVRYYGLDGVYVSFSGGLDSLVVLTLARNMYGERVKAVFADTWLEYPSLREYVKTFPNVDYLKPLKDMRRIVSEDGWCFPSKELADTISAYRKGAKWAYYKLNGLDKNGNPDPYRGSFKKFLYFAEHCPVKVSGKCCVYQKEKPFYLYESETGRVPILGLRAEESGRRRNAYYRTGCNSFSSRRALSKPISIFTKQDVLSFLFREQSQIAPPYGGLFQERCCCSGRCRYYTDGEVRTGCMFCPVGGHLNHFAKLRTLKRDYPRVYSYCMDDLGLGELVDWVETYL